MDHPPSESKAVNRVQKKANRNHPKSHVAAFAQVFVPRLPGYNHCANDSLMPAKILFQDKSLLRLFLNNEYLSQLLRLNSEDKDLQAELDKRGRTINVTYSFNYSTPLPEDTINQARDAGKKYILLLSLLFGFLLTERSDFPLQLIGSVVLLP